MTSLAPSDVAVVIPTRDRWPILAETLDALRDQTVSGHEVVVVVDGDDQTVPALPGVRVVQQAHAGPGAARNRGVAATDRAIVLFLGDDMVPARDLVERHLSRHQRETAAEVSVLGHVEWHPSLAANRLHRWLDWSATQFDYASLRAQNGADAGFARFYSCNVSLKRPFFLEAGGFDEDFGFYYEDLDCGFRLGEAGMVLRYEPNALTHHLHQYDWAALERRFRGIAVGERLMADKHPWFTPFYRQRVCEVADRPPAARCWPIVADLTPNWVPRLQRHARARANAWYHQQLADGFLEAWDGERDLAELRSYLGDRYDHRRLVRHVAEVEAEEERAPDEATFYRTSEAYLYDLTVFAMSGTKAPYRRLVRSLVEPGARLLDYGCGIGSDGLRLLEAGYAVAFADFDNPSTRYLRARLADRGAVADVFDIEEGVPGGFDLVYCFDVIEHIDDPIAFLATLESKARVVVVNFLEPTPGDTHVHKPLDVPALLDHVAARGLRAYRKLHGRSHLVAYEPGRTGFAAQAQARAILLAPRVAMRS